MKIGVYFLIEKRKVIYIGKTKSWPNRLIGHREIHFDEAKLLECDAKNIDAYELRLINIFRPKHNCSIKVHKRMTNEWIENNKDFVKKCIESNDKKDLRKLGFKAKTDLGYSPKYTNSDLKWTIVRDYCKLYKLDFDHNKGKFVPIKKLK